MYLWFQSHLLAAVGVMPDNDHNEKTIYLCRRESAARSRRENVKQTLQTFNPAQPDFNMRQHIAVENISNRWKSRPKGVSGMSVLLSRTSYIIHVMKDETRIRGAAGRKVLADPRTHRYYLCLNDGENEKFISMFEQSGMKNKAEFIFARIFGWEFKVVKIDKEAQEYYAQLTAFYQQFRRIGNNYNQCVKTIHTIYGEKKSLAFLYKLAEETRKLEEVCRQVIELTKRYEKEYLTKKE